MNTKKGVVHGGIKFRLEPIHAGEHISACEELFTSREAIRERLADFHSIDWDDSQIEATDINKQPLEELLQHGQWKIKEVAYSCPLCIDGDVEHKEHGKTHIYMCDTCPYVAFEYHLTPNVVDLASYLSNN